MTVESSANFREWSIRYHLRNRTFAVNETNSNNKLLKEKIEKTAKNINVFQIVEMDQMEQRSVVRFLRLKGLLTKVIIDELVAMLQENAISYSSVTRFYSAERPF
jgi:threonyl-tRNA synthetase